MNTETSLKWQKGKYGSSNTITIMQRSNRIHFPVINIACGLAYKIKIQKRNKKGEELEGKLSHLLLGDLRTQTKTTNQ